MRFEQKYYYVYIMASSRNGTLYIGVTSNLPQRIFEHKNHLLPGFTDRYNVDKLVYFERHDNANDAIRREKRLKDWKRNWKKDLIEKYNPLWRDLYEDLNNLL
ncbi:MAG: GIY-YIG nuclease family protein [Alphaproteobacteria bacterium]|nr:GIY-YIG nuclease family protein [Alphaproteobacteria bacterium]